MIRIYNSDPYCIFSGGLKFALSIFRDINWVGSQQEFSDLLKNLTAKHADVLITNNYLFHEDSKIEMIEKLPQIRNTLPKLKIVMLTMAGDPNLQKSLRENNLVDAFTLKTMEGEEIHRVIKLVWNCGTWWFYPVLETLN